MQSMIDKFRSARLVSAPLLVIKTTDPAATIGFLRESFNGNCPLLYSWDIVNGIQAVKPQGQLKEAEAALVKLVGPNQDPAMVTGNPVEALRAAGKLPGVSKADLQNNEKRRRGGSILFYMNAHLALLGPDGRANLAMVQATWNLRDQYKQDRRTLVLLVPDLQLPAELANDCLVIEEPLPGVKELDGLIRSMTEPLAEQPSEAAREAATSAVLGLNLFASEQAIAMSLRRDGIDIDGLWERKRQMIEQTPGLSVWRGGEKFSDIGGCDNAKDFFTQVGNGREAPRTAVFIDSI